MRSPRTRRCSLRPSAAAALPYCRKGRRKNKGRRHREGSSGTTASLSDDSLASIFARLPDVAAVIRCAATCRRWARVVATRAAIISRSLPPLGCFHPDLAVGVFHQEKDWPTSRGRDTMPSRPCFVARARFLGVGGGQQLWGLDDGGLLDYSRPVASRNGRLVLELRREGRTVDGLRLAVYNPMMSDNNIVIVPPLITLEPGGKKSTTIRDYGCALLTGHDLRPPRCHSFFRLLLIYNRKRRGRDSTLLRCYSSDTGGWGREAESDVKIHSSRLRGIGQAVVRRGVAFWALDQGVLGVRLDQIDPDAALTDMHLSPYQTTNYWSENRLLGISADNRLFLMYLGIRNGANKIPIANFLYFEFAEEDDVRAGRKGTIREREFVLMHQMGVKDYDNGIKLRWFGEKSGLVLFSMGKQSGHAGTFVLNLCEEVVYKVADDGDSWNNLLGYEMDMAGYLASMDRPSFYLSST